MESSKNCLEVSGLTAGYGKETAVVEKLDFVLEREECLCLHGASGCGKSTVIWAVMGVIHEMGGYARGKILYHAGQGTVDMVGGPAEEVRALRWKEIALVPQSSMNSFNPMYTIQKTICEVLFQHNHDMGKPEAENRCRELLHMVKLDEKVLGSYPSELSGGMKQRASIALALALDPKLLILDEATTGLDVLVEADILWVLRKLRREKKMSMLFVSHDDRIARAFCDRQLEL
jgi:peptide/nickel transport system ATP-binding protein